MMSTITSSIGGAPAQSNPKHEELFALVEMLEVGGEWASINGFEDQRAVKSAQSMTHHYRRILYENSVKMETRTQQNGDGSYILWVRKVSRNGNAPAQMHFLSGGESDKGIVINIGGEPPQAKRSSSFRGQHPEVFELFKQLEIDGEWGHLTGYDEKTAKKISSRVSSALKSLVSGAKATARSEHIGDGIWRVWLRKIPV
jgi:hypothetical protein